MKDTNLDTIVSLDIVDGASRKLILSQFMNENGQKIDAAFL